MLGLFLVILGAASQSQQKHFRSPHFLRKAPLPEYHGRQQVRQGLAGLWGGVWSPGPCVQAMSTEVFPRDVVFAKPFQETGAGLFLPLHFLTFLPSCSNVSSQLAFTDILPSTYAGIRLLKLSHFNIPLECQCLEAGSLHGSPVPALPALVQYLTQNPSKSR